MRFSALCIVLIKLIVALSDEVHGPRNAAECSEDEAHDDVAALLQSTIALQAVRTAQKSLNSGSMSDVVPKRIEDVPLTHGNSSGVCKSTPDSTERMVGIPCAYFVNAALFLLRDSNDAEDFILKKLEPLLQDRVYDFLANDEPEHLDSRMAVARHMFVLRLAWLALDCLEGQTAFQQRMDIKRLYNEIPTDLAIQEGDGKKHVKKRQAWVAKVNKMMSFVSHTLEDASGCTLYRRAVGDGGEDIPQSRRIYPKAPLTKDSYILLSGPDGKVSEDGVRMPLMSLGTGYVDCYQGKEVHYPPPGEVAKFTDDGSSCSDKFPRDGFYKDAVRAGTKAIDTAYMYGSEGQIGQELSGFEGMFLSTKTVPPQFRKGFNIPHGTSRMADQLHNLQRTSVNALFNHHDDFDLEEWALLSDEIDKGSAQILGASSTQGANTNRKCIESGRCRHQVSLVQENVSPCFGESIGSLLGSLGETNATLVGHSMGEFCKGEPILASIAKHLGRSPRAVATRWALQQGIPVIVMTSKLNHIQDNLQVFHFELPTCEMYTLNLIQKLYSFSPDWFEDGNS